MAFWSFCQVWSQRALFRVITEEFLPNFFVFLFFVLRGRYFSSLSWRVSAKLGWGQRDDNAFLTTAEKRDFLGNFANKLATAPKMRYAEKLPHLKIFRYCWCLMMCCHVSCKQLFRIWWAALLANFWIWFWRLRYRWLQIRGLIS